MSNLRPQLSDYTHVSAGKVRDIYRIDDDHVLLVVSDRISAYDYILSTPIPDKGRILTAMSFFFFDEIAARTGYATPASRKKSWAGPWCASPLRCFRLNALPAATSPAPG